MTTSTCTAFLDRAEHDPAVAAKMRAVTDPAELLALGRRLGYSFEDGELFAALSERAAGGDDAEADATPADAGPARVLHYEITLDAVPALAPILDELPQLKVKPDTVDLDGYRRSFRPDDLEWTEMSPADPDFERRYEEVMSPHWDGPLLTRRDFHLVNLDQTVDHDGYERYFDAKVRTVEHFSRVFGPEVRFSGSMWYPPFAYRLWHTNETQPGWRMYLIDFDTEVPDGDDRTFFRYMNQTNKELVTLPDRPKLLRFFQIRQDPENLLWHCIVNAAERNRWSFGFAVPDDWEARLAAAGGAQ